MKISTEIQSISNIVGYEKAVSYVAQAGFDNFDMSLFNICEYFWDKGEYIVNENNPLNKKDYIKFVHNLKRIGQDGGITCNQSHAPFPTSYLITDHLKKAIEITAEIGGKYCVIHPVNDYNVFQNAEIFNNLIPFAKAHNVIIATENMWNWKNDKATRAACSNAENFNSLLDTVNSEYLVALLDIGHAEMMHEEDSDPTSIFIKKLGNRLKCLHIHDNDKWHDSHQIPFSMDIDYNPIIKALKDINYDGEFTLEADQYLKGRDEDNVFSGVIDLKKSADRLGELFERI